MTPARYPRILLPARLACPATMLPLGRAGTPSRDAPGSARLFSLLNLGAAQVAPAFPPSEGRLVSAASLAHAGIRRRSGVAQRDSLPSAERSGVFSPFRAAVRCHPDRAGALLTRTPPPSGLRQSRRSPERGGVSTLVKENARPKPSKGKGDRRLNAHDGCATVRRPLTYSALDPSGAAGYATQQGACNLGPFQTSPARNDNDLTGNFVSTPLRRGFGPGFFAVAA